MTWLIIATHWPYSSRLLSKWHLYLIKQSNQIKYFAKRNTPLSLSLFSPSLSLPHSLSISLSPYPFLSCWARPWRLKPVQRAKYRNSRPSKITFDWTRIYTQRWFFWLNKNIYSKMVLFIDLTSYCFWKYNSFYHVGMYLVAMKFYRTICRDKL